MPPRRMVIVKLSGKPLVTKLIRFIKTTAIGGLLVIVPVAIILFVLAQLFYALYALIASITAQLGIDADDALIIVGIAALALVGLCFATGLLVQTRLGKFLKGWFGRHVGKRIPMYKAISSLTRRFAGQESEQFSPVEIDLYDSSVRLIGFRIEDLPDGRCAVFVPSAPVATVGNIYIVPRGKLTVIDATVTDTIAAITQWGVDSDKLYPGSPPQPANTAQAGDE